MNAEALVLGLFLSILFAVAPTALWTALIWWCDRWEREPWPLAAAALLWGALPAVVLSLVVEALLEAPSGRLSLGSPGSLVTAGAVAPVVEEIAKAAALAGILIARRAEIDDLLDGILYGALIGFGFGMTENLLYYVASLFTGGWSAWGATVFLRGAVFGLNHAFFTALTGAGFGFAATAGSERKRWGLPMVGLTAAIAVHAVHNLGASLSEASAAGLLLSMFNAVSGVGLVIAMLGLALRQEARWVREELAEEVGELLTPADYEALASLRGRAAMLAAARGSGGSGALRRARQAQQWSSELAFRKRQLRERGPDPTRQRDVAALREKLAAITGPRAA